MDSLSRRPHRRKHSAANAFSSSFSFKSPYDDVVLANAGERKSLEAHEYSEIFSGSSSIPVLDFPGLDDRVGPGDSRSSDKLDYSSIFGGFRNDDVFVPFEELRKRSAKKSKPRIPAEALPQESGSLHSSRKTKRSSGEASDQSADGVIQQLNVPFNKTKQKNSEVPDAETHIAQVHAVPKVTHFADGTPWPDKTKADKLPSLKHKVSRTWSFSAEVEPAKNTGGSSREPSQTNEVNLKSQFPKVPSPSNLSGNKVPGQSRVSSFASKDDGSQKTAGECSPPLFGEEFDENSADAVSAAALKKAIEQAQESIRIAKMIMERKREGYRDSKHNNAKGKHDELDHIFSELAGINRKFTPSLNHINKVERARENVEADKEKGEAFERKSKLFTLNQSDRFCNDDQVKLEKLEEKVEAAEIHRDGKENPGLVTNEVCVTVGLEPEKEGNSNSLTPPMCEVASNIGEMETGKGIFERRKVTLHHTEESEVIPKLVEEDELCHANGYESVVERASITSEMTEGLEKSVDSNDKEEHGKQLEDQDGMLSGENLILRSEYINVLEEYLIKNESPDQEKTEKTSENVRNDQHEKCYGEEIIGLRPEEGHLWFESKEQLTKEAMLEINKKEPSVPPEIEEAEKKVDEPEIVDEKQDCTGDADKPKLTDELMDNKFENKTINTSEYEAPGTIMMEANHCAYEDDVDEAVELSSSDASTIFDEANTNDTSETGEACNVVSNNQEEDHCKTVKNFEENDTIPQVKKTDSEIDQENKAELFFHLQDYEIPVTNSLHRSASEEIFVKNNLNDAFEGVSSYSKMETAGTSEEILVENKLNDSFEGLSSYSKMETVGVMEADTEENLPKDDGVSNTTSDVHDAAQDYAAKIDGEKLPEDLESDTRTEEFDFTDVRQVLEQASDCDEVSVSESASTSERTDGSSANETEDCAENAMDRTSDKDEQKDEPAMLSEEKERVEELSKGLSQSHIEPKEMDKGLNMENNKENSTETSPTEERDAKESKQHSDSKDQQQRIEAIKRGREREKDRIAVERAIREARERAFAEARERAERAAIERATAEARQRVMAEAKEKVEKANLVKRSVDKASTEAKLRAERAAVERATAEARGRALEKAMSQKISTEADRNPAERVSSSSRNNVLKHSFSSSDLESGTNTESAQRRKARLERHQRIMERAAKALAEKNMRDLLAQKEQAERNRLAESLDADIKRWASGKEGNLRALLSTLQYILGTESGWQPISLTEIITTAAVKKAYRKATLYVHPDKLQQRGASVQQKYICEKVFDLLKAAWNRFNSDER